MKNFWSHLVLRESGCRRPPSDSDVGPQSDRDVADITPQTFKIIIRSIRSLQEAEQRHCISDPNTEEPVSASFAPEATENHVGKAFLETWCEKHGFSSPAIDIICLEFFIIGQTQRFESVHQIVDNEESVLFHPNRSSARPDAPSVLEIHILQYSSSLSKRDGRTLPKEVVAVRSRTWPSKMESLRRWSRGSGNQYATKESQDKPVVRLNDLKFDAHIGRCLIDPDEVNAHRGEQRAPVVRHPSGDVSGGHVSDVSPRRTTPSIATLPGGGPPRNDFAELQDAASSDHPCMDRDTDKASPLEPVTWLRKDSETPQGSVLNRLDDDSEARFDGDVSYTSYSQLSPTIVAGPDTLRRDNELQAVKSAAGHLEENIANARASQGSDVPGMTCDTSLGLKNHNTFVAGETLSAEESQMRAQSRRAFEQSVQSGRVRSSLLDTAVLQQNHIVRNPTLLDSNPGVIGCNCIIREISQADRNLSHALEQPGESEVGNMKGDNDDCTMQEASSPAIPVPRRTESSLNKLYGLDEATVRKDDKLKCTKQRSPAGSPSAVSSPLRNVENLGTTGIQYTNTATAISSKEGAESDSRKREPGGSNGTDPRELCQVSDQASRHSSDSEDLPFPDDYWIYDDAAKNYFHVDIGDDGTETKSWYPLDFD